MLAIALGGAVIDVDVEPDILDWITAIGTAGATLIAASAVAMQLADRRRAYAEVISAWLADLGEDRPIKMALYNASNLPVYDVVACAKFQGHTMAVATVRTLRPGVTTVSTPWTYSPDHEDAVRPPGADILFKDQAGRAWHRGESGKLRRRRRGYVEFDIYLKALEEAPELPRGGGWSSTFERS